MLMKMKKRLLSILLSLVMVLGLVPGMSLTAYAAHTHSFTYNASGATITATCQNVGCDLTENKVTLTIGDPANIYWDDKSSSHEFTLVGLEAFNSATGKSISANDIVYYKGDNQTPQIRNNDVRGTTYKARLTVEGARAEHSFLFTAKPSHTHQFSYTANGATITATCISTTGTCDLTNKQATLTLNAPLHKVENDGLDAKAFFTGSIPGVTNPTINYRRSDTPLGTTAPTVASDHSYTAFCDLGNAHASVEYWIRRDSYIVTYYLDEGKNELYAQDTVRANGEGKYSYKIQGYNGTPPAGKSFLYWQGSDGVNYHPENPIEDLHYHLILTAVWKEEVIPAPQHQGGGSGSGADLVFNLPGADDGWEYIGGYVPQRAYRVSFAPMQGGSAYFVLNSGENGETMNVYPQSSVRVVPTPAPGYRLASIVWSMIDGSASYDITETQTFVMPAMDAVAYVTFQPIA